MNIGLIVAFGMVTIIGMMFISSVLDFSKQWKTDKVIEASKDEESAKNLVDSLDQKKSLIYFGFILFAIGLIGIVFTVIFS